MDGVPMMVSSQFSTAVWSCCHAEAFPAAFMRLAFELALKCVESAHPDRTQSHAIPNLALIPKQSVQLTGKLHQEIIEFNVRGIPVHQINF